MSATNPENGAVTYTYDGAHHVTSRTDAKAQATTYGYDAYGRLTAVAHYPQGVGNPADPNQQVTYYYDTNPFDSSFGYAWGRLAAVTFNNVPVGTPAVNFTYMYGYNVAGRVTAQRMRISIPSQGTWDSDAHYNWDNEGRMTSLHYPCPTCDPSQAVAFQYDAMSNLTGLSDPMNSVTASATYGVAGEMDTLSYQSSGTTTSETFSYNSLWQLTRTTATQGGNTTMDLQYVYPAGLNNGRISQRVDSVAGETVNYTYDSLNRLATAGTASGSWGQSVYVRWVREPDGQDGDGRVRHAIQRRIRCQQPSGWRFL